MKAGFIKIVCPYGVVIAGTSGSHDIDLNYAANVVGDLLDPNSEGEAWDEDVRKAMSASHGWMIGMGVGQIEEAEACVNLISEVWPLGCFGLKTYIVAYTSMLEEDLYNEHV